jgi:hypothetical protein
MFDLIYCVSPSGELTEEEKGLFAPPESVEEFRQLARRICAGKLVESLLWDEMCPRICRAASIAT